MEDISEHHCKNCESEVDGQFCTFCGQRYHAHKETFGELAVEFVSDFWHFDSRFLKTVLPLIFSPGTLTRSYNEGKQRRQFHPIRLYFFSSFVYFFLFFTFNKAEDKSEPWTLNKPGNFIIDSVGKAIRNDALNLAKNDSIKQAKKHETNNLINKDTLTEDQKKFIAFQDSTTSYSITVNSYMDSLLAKRVTPAQYLEQQQKLDSKSKDGYFTRIITIKLLNMNLIGDENKKEFFNKITETFLHNIPKMLFFLLPVFAFILKLLYFRKKQFYYVDHAILSLHFFSLIFILLILGNFILDKIFGTTVFTNLAVFWIFIYLFIAMKRLYAQSWKRTFGKYIALLFLFLFTVLFTLFVNLAVSALMT